MNTSTAEKLEKREMPFIPRIVSTEPVQKKELDLTFVQFAQRKRNALDYIASVEARREKKEIRKRNKIAKIKRIACDILEGFAMAASILAIILLGIFL